MSTAEERTYTVAEYLALEEAATQKHEFYRGKIYAMSGGSVAHNRVVSNIHFRLAQQLEGKPCLPNTADVMVNAQSLYTYPDVSVVCPPIEREPGRLEVIRNPRVLIEVLSSSTERHDRNLKFHQYQQMPSVQEILLVQQDAPIVEHYARANDGAWIMTSVNDLAGEVALSSIQCRLRLSQIYANVEFPVEPFKVVPLPFPPSSAS